MIARSKGAKGGLGVGTTLLRLCPRGPLVQFRHDNRGRTGWAKAFSMRALLVTAFAQTLLAGTTAPVFFQGSPEERAVTSVNVSAVQMMALTGRLLAAEHHQL